MSRLGTVYLLSTQVTDMVAVVNLLIGEMKRSDFIRMLKKSLKEYALVYILSVYTCSRSIYEDEILAHFSHTRRSIEVSTKYIGTFSGCFSSPEWQLCLGTKPSHPRDTYLLITSVKVENVVQ